MYERNSEPISCLSWGISVRSNRFEHLAKTDHWEHRLNGVRKSTLMKDILEFILKRLGEIFFGGQALQSSM